MASAVGSGATGGSGSALVIGATSGGSVTVGSASDVAIAGRLGIGASVGASGAAGSGVRPEPVHATDAIRANTTSGRIANLPTGERASHGPVTGQPTAPKRKQAVDAVQSASAGLTGPEASP